MKCKILPFNEEEINAFLATPGIKVSTKHAVAVADKIGEVITGCVKVMIYYETAEDDAAFKDRIIVEQHTQMERLLDIAREVKKDDRFTALKNNTQREIFLFARYNIPGSDAAKVAELLKPEMTSVLGA